MAIAAMSSIPCMKTASGVCGPEPSRVCGSGRPVRRTAMTRRSIAREQALVAGEQGAGLIAITGAEDRVLLQSDPQRDGAVSNPGRAATIQSRESAAGSSRCALDRNDAARALAGSRRHESPSFRRKIGFRAISSALCSRIAKAPSGQARPMDSTAFAKPPSRRSPPMQGLSTPVGCVLAARDGSLWIGSYGGLNRWTQGRMTIYRATPPPRSVAAREHKTGSGRGETTQ